MSKNITHFAPAYTREGGGIFEVVENLSLAQLNNNSVDKITIVCPEISGQKKNITDKYGRDIKYILPLRMKTALSFISIFRSLLALVRRSDILHIHGAWSAQFVLLLPILFICDDVRIVYQPHGLLNPVKQKKSAIKKRLVWYVYQKWLLEKSSIILACSEAESQELAGISICKTKIKVLPNGVDSSFFVPINPEKRLNRLLFFSQIIPIKGLEPLLDAIGAMAKDKKIIPLDIYGYGPSSYVNKLNKKIDFLGISQHVKLKGKVGREDRVEVYDRYQHFILPSFNENFGICVIEAISRGCAVMVSSETPWADPRFQGIVRLFKPRADEIEKQLRTTFFENKPVSISQQLANAQLVRKYFSWEKIGERSIELYAKR